MPPSTGWTGARSSATSSSCTAPKLEELRRRWFMAPDEAAQAAIGREIQLQAFQDVPFLPLGQYFQPTVQQRSLTGTLTGLPLFWGVRRG